MDNCERCGSEMGPDDIFPVRELPPDPTPRKMNDVIRLDEFGLVIPDWKVKRVCRACITQILGGENAIHTQ